jgi:hypothetical protein
MEAIGSGASFLDQGLFGQFVALHGSSSKLFSISTQTCLSCGQVMSLNGLALVRTPGSLHSKAGFKSSANVSMEAKAVKCLP